MTKPVQINQPSRPGSVLLTCWECRAETAAQQEAAAGLLCRECGKLQPLPSGTDYFGFFGLPKKLGLDAAALEKQFHQLSWEFHPDRLHQASSYERELSLELTAALNDAYRTLREPVRRTEYLLRLEEIRKDGEVKQQAPPDLLKEVFELNEQLEELREARRAGGQPRQLDELRHQLAKACETFQQKLAAVLAALAAEFVHWDALIDAESPDAARRTEVLGRLNDILNRHNYVRNLVTNVTEELEE